MNKIIAFLITLFIGTGAFAQTCNSNLGNVFVPAQINKLCSAFGSAIVNSVVPSASNTYNLGSSSKTWANVYVGTASVMSVGANVQLAAYVPTMAATPVTGTNFFAPGLSIVPTAAANTAAFLGPATPIAGQQFRINNNSGASVRVKAAGGATLNGATAGGYIVVPNLATVDCLTASTSNQVCMQPVIPTPAGP